MCKSRILLIVILFCVSAVPISNAANVIYVDANGPNEPGSGTFDDPFHKIQVALNAAFNGDIVEIRAGIYTADPNNYNLDPNGKSITIRSTDPNDPEVIANTIIDPNGAGRGFYFHSGEDANCLIAGLTIRGAYFNGDGGAIGCFGSGPVIKNCVIANNEGRYGGGIGSSSTSSPTLINCTLVKNSAFFNGGGIYCFDSNTSVENCIIWQNEVLYASEGHQVGLEYQSIASISYTDIQNGQEGISSIESTLFWLSGNIDTDPCFASFDANDDPNLWDFHLQSAYGRWDENFYRVDFNKDRIINLLDFAELAGEWLKEGSNLPEDLNRNGKVDWVDLQILTTYFLTTGYRDGWVFDSMTSPCIDAGDPNSDWAGEPWPNGRRINMGAYGGTNQASMNGNPADFNIDGAVDFVDFADFSSKWLAEGSYIEDLSDDGVVEFADLGIFVENWLWQENPADFNGDGEVNLLDYCLFANAWQTNNSGISLDDDDDVDYYDLAIFCRNWPWHEK